MFMLADLLKRFVPLTNGELWITQGEKALAVPLEKPALERVTRGAGYTRVRQEVSTSIYIDTYICT